MLMGMMLSVTLLVRRIMPGWLTLPLLLVVLLGPVLLVKLLLEMLWQISLGGIIMLLGMLGMMLAPLLEEP